MSARAVDPPSSPAERFLHDGRFAEGESALLLALDANSANDEARFGLGVIQFVRAVENLGQRRCTVWDGIGECHAAIPEAPRAEKREAIGHQLQSTRAGAGRVCRRPRSG